MPTPSNYTHLIYLIGKSLYIWYSIKVYLKKYEHHLYPYQVMRTPENQTTVADQTLFKKHRAPHIYKEPFHVTLYLLLKSLNLSY
jgi:hypothetical protein